MIDGGIQTWRDTDLEGYGLGGIWTWGDMDLKRFGHSQGGGAATSCYTWDLMSYQRRIASLGHPGWSLVTSAYSSTFQIVCSPLPVLPLLEHSTYRLSSLYFFLEVYLLVPCCPPVPMNK